MEVIGYIAGFFTLVAFLPQTIRTIRIRETRDLSLTTFAIITLSGVLWVIFGLSNHKPEIWVTNSIAAICNGIIVVLKIKHG
jgi:MtN3 and saliva related transmembrane protein